MMLQSLYTLEDSKTGVFRIFIFKTGVLTLQGCKYIFLVIIFFFLKHVSKKIDLFYVIFLRRQSN